MERWISIKFWRNFPGKVDTIGYDRPAAYSMLALHKISIDDEALQTLADPLEFHCCNAHFRVAAACILEKGYSGTDQPHSAALQCEWRRAANRWAAASRGSRDSAAGA
jgi:hypothetical protein